MGVNTPGIGYYYRTGRIIRCREMMKTIHSIDDLAEFIANHRKSLELTQIDLAGASGLGPRFIGDLERGKPTCEIGKTLQVLTMLGIELQVITRPDTHE